MIDQRRPQSSSSVMHAASIRRASIRARDERCGASAIAESSRSKTQCLVTQSGDGSAMRCQHDAVRGSSSSEPSGMCETAHSHHRRSPPARPPARRPRHSRWCAAALSRGLWTHPQVVAPADRVAQQDAHLRARGERSRRRALAQDAEQQLRRERRQIENGLRLVLRTQPAVRASRVSMFLSASSRAIALLSASCSASRARSRPASRVASCCRHLVPCLRSCARGRNSPWRSPQTPRRCDGAISACQQAAAHLLRGR